MLKLKELLSGVEYKNRPKALNTQIENLSCNSKDIRKRGLFVAINGETINGHNFIQEAIFNGAKVVVCERDFKSTNSVTRIIVNDAREALAILAKNFYKTDLKKNRLIGITGTNGKTTISLLVESILSQAHFKTALIGTLGYRINGKTFIKLTNTTPGALELHNLLNRVKKRSANYTIIEVSSHALDQYRVKGLKFNAAIFSNLSQDHLDYHKNMKNYLKAKAELFKQLSSCGLAIINKDDSSFEYLAKVTSAKIFTYALKNKADFVAKDIQLGIDRSQFLLKTPSGEIPITSKLVGVYNIYNILAASSYVYCEGIKLELIKRGIEALIRIPGRLQRIQQMQSFKVFVDYAHTPDALENVLTSLRELSTSGNRIITIFGCGGQRDKTKRPKMAKIAQKYSDFVIITTDNPRGEDPHDIFKDIEAGFTPLACCAEAGFTNKNFKRYRIILDRYEAIEKGINLAKNGDIVLIAGKGHENIQIFKDKVMPFNDIQVAREILKRRQKL